ncbi:trichohyalin-like [Xyrichtys novacula]|uniref:Trichohyalin-like n=1 Tax=Xyrichtys novacula TaxID=13765 RepID=A0AAV1FBW0_XYRNO|nr:trichohyalin-like [Xyrichtys novacula]
MQHSQRLDQRLHMLRKEVRIMAQDKEHGDQIWMERLQRCQRQLKAKDDEMSRQSQYFENFKTQLQQKLSLARDKEQSLQNRIYTLEKQLLDMTVSAATGMTMISAVRITAGTVTRWEEQQRLPPMRGEGEGEEERKEEKRKQWQPSESMMEKNKQENQNSNEARLQGFILSLQEDLQVLLEREEEGLTQRRELMEQLQEAQESSHLLGCKVEEMKLEVDLLKQSERSLLEKVQEVREENHRLQQIIKDPASQTSEVPESTTIDPGTRSPFSTTTVCPVPSNAHSYTTATGHTSESSLGEVHLFSNGESSSSAVAPLYHQATPESSQTTTEAPSLSKKSKTPPKEDPLNLHSHAGFETDPSSQSLSFTIETLDEFKMGTWCSGGIFNLEESPSEESDALRDAYRTLGFGENLEALREQLDRLKVAQQHSQEQLEVMTQENSRLKLQLYKDGDLHEAKESTKEKMNQLFIGDRVENDTIPVLARDDLLQALNQENRALGERIQELLTHIEHREEEFKKEESQLRDLISKLEVDGVRLEQENQEQGSLITELTKKTEDDLNTIMELQQRLEESKQHTEESQADQAVSGPQQEHENTAAVSGCVQLQNVVESTLKGGESYLMSCQQPDDVTTTLVPKSHQHNHYDLLQNSQQNRSIKSLKTEKEELLSDINSLREQQKEVALSVKTQTEVKQQLTRTVWGLKEEKDCISKSLTGVRQEKEQLTRTVCGLRDERDQLKRSMSGLKEEKEQLTERLSGLRAEKETLTESVSSGKGERDQISLSLQSLQTEREQLYQTVLDLRQDRDVLTASSEYLKEQKEWEQSSYILQEDQDRLRKSISSLKEEKKLTEQSVSRLKEDEKQMNLLVQGLREERITLQTEKQLLKHPDSPGTTQRQHTETLGWTAATLRCQTDANTENLKQDVIGKQEQSDLMQEIEALRAELRKSRDEVDKSNVDARRLHSELHQSENRREEAETKAAQAAAKLMRAMDAANQVEEIREKNNSLTTQVNELQSKLRGVIREKTDALSLKAEIEEQYNILMAQLKAKTVALEELNLEYIALKQVQDSKDDVGTVLVTLRTRYNNIRSKYDDLLRKRSQLDLEIAPLKAKLSCLVLKCQQRNSLLVQMMKTMSRQGHVDPTLIQQVEEVLSDTVIQDYSAAFTPGCMTNEYSTGFTPEFISNLQDCASGFTPDQSCFPLSPHINQQNVFTPQSGGMYGGLKSFEKSAKSSKNPQDLRSQVSSAPTGTLKRDCSSPVQEHTRVPETSSPVVPALKVSLDTDTAQLPPSAGGLVLENRVPEKVGYHQLDIRGKSPIDSARLPGSSLSPTPLSSSTRVGASRRLSSPEKILNLHEQLQKTLQSSYQTSVHRGRGQQPRKCLSFSAPAADLNPASPTVKQSLCSNKPQNNSVPVTSALSRAKSATAVTTIPVAKTTLYDAITSRSANVTSSPNIFTNHHFKPDISKSITPSSSPHLATMEANEAKSSSRSWTNTTECPKLTKKNAATPDVSDARHAASTPSTSRTTGFDCNISICSDTDPKTTASDTTALSLSAAQETNYFNTAPKTDGAVPANDRPAFTAPYTHPSPERSIKSAALEKTKKARPKPEAPSEVQSVEVIKTVGQSSLMIGWERPTLDELGCSNATFVYGYRVFVDGDFHKSVMSSACTKCILENVNLSLPVHISVQTLGSNGLTSNSVHTLYRASNGTDHHSPN